jgi:hypothetical protein
MKQLFQKALVRLSKDDLNELTKEVKETVAVGQVAVTHQKTFTSPELWRIQQLKKPVAIRRGLTLWQSY